MGWLMRIAATRGPRRIMDENDRKERFSLAGQPNTTNTRTVTVRIPRSQVFDTAQLRELMGRANRGELL